jgi:hypothetical protein
MAKVRIQALDDTRAGLVLAIQKTSADGWELPSGEVDLLGKEDVATELHRQLHLVLLHSAGFSADRFDAFAVRPGDEYTTFEATGLFRANHPRGVDRVAWVKGTEVPGYLSDAGAYSLYANRPVPLPDFAGEDMMPFSDEDTTEDDQ